MKTILALFVAVLVSVPCLNAGGLRVICTKNARPLERLAAAEVVRYTYLRTGQLPKIGGGFFSSYRIILRRDATQLGPQEFTIKTVGKDTTITGGSDVGVLYGAYRYTEWLGVRFYLHGDVVPDEPLKEWPVVNEAGKPLFDTRGIQPFHDFEEGPDWWDQDDYLATLSQLAKLRMNFIGLHCYPEGGVGPEAGVWIGSSGDLGEGGNVKFSYSSFWANTAKHGTWGCAAMKTGDFAGGAAQLFADDVYGPAVMAGMMPCPANPQQCNDLFNRVGAMFHVVFTQARALGIKTCIGTETPLTIPKAVQQRLKEQGKDPKDPAVVRQVYEGMFRRIAATHPLDYYWLWTPEEWTWKGNKPEQFQSTAADIHAALAALDSLGKPFTLATCGWVLGPQHDRSALDKLLPKECPMSCINRQLGHAGIDSAFAQLSGRPRWAIPWMENDPNLAGPQPWVGRMRYDAADARRLGCTGLLGIHWRTKAMAPNVAALAAAAWDQSWVPSNFETLAAKRAAEHGDPTGNSVESFKPVDKAGTNRTMPVGDFYVDFARASFGDAVAEGAGAILSKIDGVHFPKATNWIGGPGAVKSNPKPWDQEQQAYRFVGELETLRAQVRGEGNLARFDYWLNSFRAARVMGEAACLRGEFDRQMVALDKEPDAVRKATLASAALVSRLRLARLWEQMLSLQVAAVDTPGELGTLSNLERHSRAMNQFLSKHDAALKTVLGHDLPPEAQPSPVYGGPARLIVPTVRSVVGCGEPLRLRIMVLRGADPVVHLRPLGQGDWKTVPAEHLGRAVYEAKLPPARGDFEYFITAGENLVWPATAPHINQTVVCMESDQ